jgi:DNA-3-methyladenine glycosylase I
MERCGWVTQDPLYLAYHDNEWGVAVSDRQKLFEMICLEGQQAGLSWITVLKKRENYRQCFHYFVPEAVAQMTVSDIDNLMQNAGIIRHRGKIEAIINNAKALLAMEAKGEDFPTLVWSFVKGKPIVTSPGQLSEIPTKTEASEALSRALKQRGFKFTGATICYAFMQACGLVNDHVVECFCHQDKS